MKRLALASALLLTPAYSYADQLKFAWDYSTTDQANIAGFKLYRDGVILEPVTIPATARTVTVDRQTDKQSHTYHLTAFSAEEESGPSQTAIDIYSPNKPRSVTGALTIQVIK